MNARPSRATAAWASADSTGGGSGSARALRATLRQHEAIGRARVGRKRFSASPIRPCPPSRPLLPKWPTLHSRLLSTCLHGHACRQRWRERRRTSEAIVRSAVSWTSPGRVSPAKTGREVSFVGVAGIDADWPRSSCRVRAAFGRSTPTNEDCPPGPAPPANRAHGATISSSSRGTVASPRWDGNLYAVRLLLPEQPHHAGRYGATLWPMSAKMITRRST